MIQDIPMINEVNLKEALGIAMQASIKDIDLINFAVFGPRRSGTNYLQKLILLNTLNMRFLCLDKKYNDQNCKLILHAYSELGSKHSMNDIDISHKFGGDHCNIVIIKSDLKKWLYSRVAYQKTFNQEFVVSDKALHRFIEQEYLKFMQLICDHRVKYNILFLKYEELSVASLRDKLVAFDPEIILTEHVVDLHSSVAPSGGITGKNYTERKSIGDLDIDLFCESNVYNQLKKQQIDLIQCLS